MMVKTMPFVITSKCERNCLYCFKEPMEDVSYWEFVRKLEKEIKNNTDLKKVVLTGGDPILNEDFFKMCEHVKKKYLRLKVTGTYERSYDLEKYVGLVDEVSIPLDSLREDVNDYLRGRGAYKKSLDSMDFFLKRGIKSQIHTVVNSKNIKEMKEFREWLENKQFLIKNTWKLFRFIKFKHDFDLSIDDTEWEKVKEMSVKNRIFAIDNVLQY